MKIERRIEVIQCRFLWEDEEDKRKFHLVKWEEIKKLIFKGGLGIKSLVEMNVTLQGKWLWRYFQEEEGLWRKIIAAR